VVLKSRFNARKEISHEISNDHEFEQSRFTC